MITFSDPCDQIVAALFVCDENLGDLKKNANNEHFKRKYADLGATCEAIQTGLTAGKLLVIQTPANGPEHSMGVETLILHASGQWMRPDPFFLPLTKIDAQGGGSAITYARRYALAAIFNLAPEDDDANAASTKPAPAAGARRAQNAPPAAVAHGADPNALLLKAVEVGVIPGPDRLMFKAWAREKVPGCQNLADATPLTPLHFAAIEKALNVPQPLRAVPDGKSAPAAAPKDAEARKRRSLRTSILSLCRGLGLSDDARHEAEKRHHILGMRDEIIDQVPVALLESLLADLTQQKQQADVDPDEALDSYAEGKLL